jgi:hypothetical protein
MLTVDDAKDIIDIYGPHRKRWPPIEAAQIDALLKGDRELADYLKRQQEIDRHAQQLAGRPGRRRDRRRRGWFERRPDEEEDEDDPASTTRTTTKSRATSDEDQEAQQGTQPPTTGHRGAPAHQLDPDAMPTWTSCSPTPSAG